MYRNNIFRYSSPWNASYDAKGNNFFVRNITIMLCTGSKILFFLFGEWYQILIKRLPSSLVSKVIQLILRKITEYYSHYKFLCSISLHTCRVSRRLREAKKVYLKILYIGILIVTCATLLGTYWNARELLRISATRCDWKR